MPSGDVVGRDLIPGEPAPWFVARCTANSRFHFDSVAGRPVVLSFLGSASSPSTALFLQELSRHAARFDDTQCCFFGVSVDSDDERLGRLRQSLPGFRYFWDFDYQISLLYGAMREIRNPDSYTSLSVILDERLRIVSVVPFRDMTPERHAAAILQALDQLPPLPGTRTASIQAPVLVVPRLFEPELCRQLIAYYDQHGGEESGFMREVEGKTVPVVDHSFKRRRDQEITESTLRDQSMHRIHDRLLPEIMKAFQFRATRIERHIVACYDSQSGGHFSPHRDNTTRGTAHRKFAVSLNLNTGDYEGGKLRFPEFGGLTYEAPAGGAVVFSCSLLHEATPVTAGRRYAYLPFLYDEEGARIREANLPYLRNSPSASHSGSSEHG